MKALAAGIGLILICAITSFAEDSLVYEPNIQAAERLRAAIQITDEEKADAVGASDYVVALPMDQVFNQGRSNWCWAYAAFHTMRATYAYLDEESEELRAWQDAIDEINSPSLFWSYMAARRSTGQMGHPSWFRNHFRQRSGGEVLPAQDWRGIWARGAKTKAGSGDGGFSGFDKSDLQMGRAQLVAKLKANLEAGIASTWCGAEHCVTIYGATIRDGRAVSYYVADSQGSLPTYISDASRMNARLELLFTRDL